MKYSNLKYLAALLCPLSFLFGVQQAFAAGTIAGTDITNQATLNFTVGGVAQPAQTSNVATFKVDRKINVVVAQVGNVDTLVAPGAVSQVTTFTVTNTSNATMDFSLAALNKAGGPGPNGGTDNFDATNLRVFVDSNGNGVYDPLIDTVVFVDELPADTTRTVFVVADIPLGRVNNDIAAVTLTATAADGATPGSLGPTSVQTAGADTPGAVDTVFADGAGDTDAARDGKFSAASAYRVVTATIAVVKSSVVISDPFNGASNPKAIPGARVRYSIVVTNSGATAATAVVLTDGIPTNTSYVVNTITLNGVAKTDAADADQATFAANTVTVNIGALAAAGTATVTFDVTVN